MYCVVGLPAGVVREVDTRDKKTPFHVRIIVV